MDETCDERRRAAVRIARYLGADMVIPDMKASDRADAIRELVGKTCAKVGCESENKIANAAISRELEFGTAIGLGICAHKE